MKNFIKRSWIVFIAIIFTSSAVFASTTHKIIYDLDGGMITSKFVREMSFSETAELPTAEKDYYVFKGWIDEEGNTLERLSNISKTTLVKAEWTPLVYSVTFLDQGEEVSKTNYSYGTGIEDLSVYSTAIQQNHPYEDFVGWSEDGTNIVTSLTPQDHDDKALTAVFKGKEYSITYELDEGTSENPETYRYGEGVQLQDGQRDGYDFEGWYLNDEKVTEIGKEMHENVTLVAKWSVKEVPQVSQGSGYTSVSSASSNAGATTSYAVSYDLSYGAHIPAMGYHVSQTVEDGDQSDIDRENCGMYDIKNYGYHANWVFEDGSTVTAVEYNHLTREEKDAHGNGEYVPHEVIRYFDHASQGLSQLPYRISAGDKFYLNGVSYTYTGEWSSGDFFDYDHTTAHDLIIFTCTPANDGTHYFAYFDRD